MEKRTTGRQGRTVPVSALKAKFCLTAVLLLLVIVLGVMAFQRGRMRQKLSLPDSLELVAVTVDGRELTLRELAFYIAYEEGQIEEDARIYNPEDTGEYWKIYTNHTFFRTLGRDTAMEMAVHDEIFYQMAAAEGIELTEEEERRLANSQYDFWSDLEEEQRERLGAGEEDLKESMRRLAYAEKYQGILAEMEGGRFEEYSISGQAYQELLEEHSVEINAGVWERVNFGGITVVH